MFRPREIHLPAVVFGPAARSLLTNARGSIQSYAKFRRATALPAFGLRDMKALAYQKPDREGGPLWEEASAKHCYCKSRISRSKQGSPCLRAGFSHRTEQSPRPLT